MQAETAVLLTDVVGEAAHPLRGEIDDYNLLMDLIGEASLVLIGEASHGTHENSSIASAANMRAGW